MADDTQPCMVTASVDKARVKYELRSARNTMRVRPTTRPMLLLTEEKFLHVVSFSQNCANDFMTANTPSIGTTEAKRKKENGTKNPNDLFGKHTKHLHNKCRCRVKATNRILYSMTKSTLAATRHNSRA